MQINDLLIGMMVAAGVILLAVGVFYLIARWALVRVAERVSDRIAAQIEASPILRQAGTSRSPAANAARGFARTQRLATLMDSAVRLPVVGGVGLDAILGLFPVLGDAVAASVGLKIILDTIQYGLPKPIVAKMIGNLCVDVAIGAIPVVGDLVDVAFKANIRNVALVQEYLKTRDESDHRSKPLKGGRSLASHEITSDVNRRQPDQRSLWKR